MRWTCHVVPSLALGLLLSGCYLAHETCGLPPGQVCCDLDRSQIVPSIPDTCPVVCPRGAVPRGGLECLAGPPPPLDGGMPPPPPPRDAGRDAGLRCPLARASATCLESFLVSPGLPFELPVAFDTCGCCIDTECRVEVATVLGAPTLRLETTMCPDPCDCDACVMPEARCAVPALSEGLWNVVVNGAPAFALPVFADSGVVPPPPACASYADPDRCALSEGPLDPSGWRPRRVCVHERGWEGGPTSTAITVTNDCWGCGDLHGPCVASLQPRFTDDLPPGGEIFLAPTAFPSACDVDCPAICVESERRCLVPRLTPGDYYRVWADGEPMLTFIAGEPGPRCSD